VTVLPSRKRFVPALAVQNVGAMCQPQYLISQGKSPLGFLDLWLYGRGLAGLGDITSGWNPGCGTDGFPVGSCHGSRDTRLYGIGGNQYLRSAYSNKFDKRRYVSTLMYRRYRREDPSGPCIMLTWQSLPTTIVSLPSLFSQKRAATGTFPQSSSH